MVTEEEKEEIINLAVEKAMLALPEVVGNLMMNQAAKVKTFETFYKEHPEYVKHQQLVASVFEYIDGNNPTLSYEEKSKMLVPEIKKRISIVEKLNTKEVQSNIDRNFNGVI